MKMPRSSCATLPAILGWASGVAWLASCAIVAAGPTYYGYYAADSEAYGHYMDKVVIPSDGTRLRDYTNLIQIDIGLVNGQSNPRRAVIDAANLGYKILLYGATGLDQPNDPAAWQAGFNEIRSVVQGYEKFVYSVDLVDEPDGRGWSRNQIESLIDSAKTYFNNSMPMTVNLDAPATQPPPRNMDVYMFDYYVNGGLTRTTKAEYETAMSRAINAIRSAAPGKPILILGSSWSDSTTSPYQGWLLPTAEQTQWYFDTAQNTREVDALMWFTLGNPSPPVAYGAIHYPDLLNQHKQFGAAILPHPENLVVDERFNYGNSRDLAAAYQGLAPALTSAREHGDNGGKAASFVSGAEMGVRQVFPQNQTGSLEAFLYDATVAPSHYFGFRAVNASGNSVAVFARGGADNPNYFLTDDANGQNALDTGTPSLAHWQKVEFVFDGRGVKALVDSRVVYENAAGWEGGFSGFGFYDPWASSGSGFVDDVRVFEISELALSVNRDSGEVAIVNHGARPVDFNSYVIASPAATLNAPQGWNPMHNNPSFAGWQVSGSPSRGRVAEAHPQGAASLVRGSIALGNLYDPQHASAARFGQNLEDLSFQYVTATGQVVHGTVSYTGAPVINNLVLTVDPATGRAQISNPSPFPVSIDAYTVTSTASLLNTWTGLEGNEQADAGWQRVESSNASRLTELNPAGAELLAPGGANPFDLGRIFSSGAQDLVFQFVLASDAQPMTGVVLYQSIAPFSTADFDRDGEVDGGDLTVWHGAFGASAAADADGDNDSDGADFLAWQRQLGGGLASFGSSTTVPEPTSLLLAVSCVTVLRHYVGARVR